MEATALADAQAPLADASTEAASAIERYIEYLEKEIAPKTKGSFRLGQNKFEQKLRLD